MPKITQLAAGRLNSDQLTIELVRPVDMPAMVRIVWPLQATVVSPREFSEIAAVAARLFATASTELCPQPGPGTAVTTAVLEQIRARLLAEAERSLAAADAYRVSKRQGERNSAPIYAFQTP